MKNPRYFLLLVLGITVLTMSVLTMAQEDHDDNMDMADPMLIERGAQVFATVGCVGCHGQGAIGTDIAPALAGHNEFQVRRQVRAPTNIMLVFGPTQVPAEDLDALIAYILSLEPMEMEGESGEHDMHDMSGVTLGDIVFAHHWLLWLELQAGDMEGSLHHTAHILELLIDGPHKAMMQPVLTALGSGDLDAAKAIVEPMVTDVGDFSHDPFVVGEQLVHMAAAAGDQEAALHFATDLTEHVMTDEQIATATTLLEHVEACELDEAAMVVEMELGDDTNFVPASMTMQMDMGDDHADDSAMTMEDDHGDDSGMDMEGDHADDSGMNMDDHAESPCNGEAHND